MKPCISNRTYQRHITPRLMGNQNAQISSWKRTSGFIVKRNRTIGINGYHSQNSRIIRCRTQPLFDLIMGYTPRIEWNFSPSQIPAVEERLGKLEDNRVEAFKNILKAQRVSRRPAHSTYLRLTHKLWASYGHALGLSD